MIRTEPKTGAFFHAKPKCTEIVPSLALPARFGYRKCNVCAEQAWTRTRFGKKPEPGASDLESRCF